MRIARASAGACGRINTLEGAALCGSGWCAAAFAAGSQRAAAGDYDTALSISLSRPVKLRERASERVSEPAESVQWRVAR